MTSPRCYDKQHQHRPGPLTERTWDEHDWNTLCEACSQLEEPGVTYLVRQCLDSQDCRREHVVVVESSTWRSRQTGSIRPCQPLQVTSSLPAEGGAPVNLFTQGAIAGHAGPPQAGLAGAGPSLTLLQGQLMIAKALSVTVLLLPGVILLRGGQAHVYPPVPISETILSVTLDPSPFFCLYTVFLLWSRTQAT